MSYQEWNEKWKTANQNPGLPKKTPSSFEPLKGREASLKYAMKMGMTDSIRGIKQMYGNITNNDELLETLKSKDEKLRRILEHPKYGSDALKYYLGSAVALDPVGWIPFVGWGKKADTLGKATRYGVGMGAAYSGMSYVGEGESRLLNTATGATLGGTLGYGAAKIGKAVSKALGKDTNFAPSITEREQTNLEDRALLARMDKTPTPDEMDIAINKTINDLRDEKPDDMLKPIKSFYKENGGDKLWDVAVQNWGTGLVGAAAGLGGYSAFDDPESTEAQKITAGLLLMLGGGLATKAIGKIGINTEDTVSTLMSKGIVDNYGLPKQYTELVKKSFGDVNALSHRFIEVVRKTQTLTPEENKQLWGMMSGELDNIPDLVGFSKEGRAIVKETGQAMVDAGLLSEKVFQKNADTYLHRSYMKHIMDSDGNPEVYQAAREMKIIGDELKPRGAPNEKIVTIKAYQNSLNPESKNFGRYSEYKKQPVVAMVSEKVYDKKLEKLAKKKNFKLEDYRLNKTITDIRDWKVISQDDGTVFLESTKKINLRRDYNKEERVAMGEIENASFAIAETGRLMTNDLAVFKLYENLAKAPDLSMSKISFEAQVSSGKIREDDWIRVADDSIAGPVAKVDGEPIKRYGKLAGQYVPKEVYKDLTKINKLKTDDSKLLNGYLATNRLWKKTKTAWNPVVHVNNTVSNVILYDLADANYKFMARGFDELRKGMEGASDADLYKLAQSYGVFDVDMVSKELNKEVSDTLTKTLQGLSDDLNPEIVNAQKYSIDTFKQLAAKGYNMTAGKLESLYQSEDAAFRMGLFMDRISKGMSPAEAAADAKKWFIDYDINAPLINLMRRGPTPFLSYTYRVVPLLAESAIRRPWKFAKWSTGAYMLNEAGKKYGAGDEEQERVLMRDSMKEKLFGIPFLPSTTIKTPFSSERPDYKGNDIPLYLDLKRFIPGGDVFSLGEKSLGVPIPFTDRSIKIPSTLAPSFGAVGEVFIPLMTGVDPFTLQKLDGLGMGNDDKVKMQHILSRLTPNIPTTAFTHPLFGNTDNWYPFSQSFGSKKISKAFRQAETGASSKFGTDFTPFEAIMSTFGFKLQPVEFSKLIGIKNAEFSRGYASSKKKIYQLGKQIREGSISKEEGQRQANIVYERLNSLQRKYKATQDKLKRVQNYLGGSIRQGYSIGGSVDVPLEQELKTLQLQAESSQALTLRKQDLYNETLNDVKTNRQAVNVGGAIKKVIKLYHGSGVKFDKFDKSKSIMGLMGKGIYFTPDKKIASRYTDTSEKNIKKMYSKKYRDQVLKAKKGQVDKHLYEVEASLSDNEILLVNPLSKQNKEVQAKVKTLMNDYNVNVDIKSKGFARLLLEQLGDDGADILPMYGIKAIKKDLTKDSALKGKMLGGDIEYSILDDSVLEIKKRTGFVTGGIISTDPADVKKYNSEETYNEGAGPQFKKPFTPEAPVINTTPVAVKEEPAIEKVQVEEEPAIETQVTENISEQDSKLLRIQKNYPNLRQGEKHLVTNDMLNYGSNNTLKELNYGTEGDKVNRFETEKGAVYETKNEYKIEFVNTVFNSAKDLGYSDTYAELIAGQAAKETGYGARAGANLFGIQYSNDAKNQGYNFKSVVTHEELKEGQPIKKTMDFVDLSDRTIKENILYYTSLIEKRFPEVKEQADLGNLKEAVQYLKTKTEGGLRTDVLEGGNFRQYATDRNYVKGLLQTITGTVKRLGRNK